jgi:hypothetical protein
MLLVKMKYDEYGYLTHTMPLDSNPMDVRNYPRSHILHLSIFIMIIQLLPTIFLFI